MDVFTVPAHTVSQNSLVSDHHVACRWLMPYIYAAFLIEATVAENHGA